MGPIRRYLLSLRTVLSSSSRRGRQESRVSQRKPFPLSAATLMICTSRIRLFSVFFLLLLLAGWLVASRRCRKLQKKISERKDIVLFHSLELSSHITSLFFCCFFTTNSSSSYSALLVWLFACCLLCRSFKESLPSLLLSISFSQLVFLRLLMAENFFWVFCGDEPRQQHW